MTRGDTTHGMAFFLDSVAPDYHLQATSIAIDAGTTLSAPTVDFDGTPRPQGLGIDIGAYEYGLLIGPPTLPAGTLGAPYTLEHAGGDGDADGVVEEGAEQVLADGGHGEAAQATGPHDAAQVALSPV